VQYAQLVALLHHLHQHPSAHAVRVSSHSCCKLHADNCMQAKNTMTAAQPWSPAPASGPS
jgi:hypothetical protein